jgi:probable F420-dependent oxidoreductase
MLLLSELFTLAKPEDEDMHVRFAREAEDAGFDGVLAGEHVVLGGGAAAEGMVTNPRDAVRPHMQAPTTPWPNPLIKLAAISSVTSHVRLVACAVLAPLYPPLLLAKLLATLDLYSRGRLTVLPTVSWSQEEYEAMGIPWTQRGRRLDEHLAIWQRVWSESPASFEGRHYQFEDVYMEPKPYRKGGPKIWFGGDSMHDAVVRRVVKYGAGYTPGAFMPAADDWNKLADAMQQGGRDIAELEIMFPLLPEFDSDDKPADLAANIDRLVAPALEQGFNVVGIKPSCFIDDPEEMGQFCREVVHRIEALC